MTNATTPKLANRGICYTDGKDIACDNSSLFISTGGLISAGSLQTSGYVSAGTINTSGTVKVSSTLYADVINVPGGLVADSVAWGNVTGKPVSLTDLIALAPDDGVFAVGNGTTWTAESGATARTSLGLGTMATQNANAVAITGGTAHDLTTTSATSISASLVDATRNGTISGTYGYFHYLSGTSINGTFTGDGSGLTGITAASSDRITSGTALVVVNSATSIVSFTSGGITTGYYTPGGIFSAVGISTSSNQASFTTVYASGKVGVGTSAPQAALQVSGSLIVSATGQTTTPTLYVDTSGRVGIRTNAPSHGLHLEGTDFYTGSSSWNTAIFRADRGYSNFGSGSRLGAIGAALVTMEGGMDQEELVLRGSSGQTADIFIAEDSNGVDRLNIKSTGNVGVGTNSPQATLQVSGSMIVSVTGQTTTPSLYVNSSGNVGMGTNSPVTGYSTNNKMVQISSAVIVGTTGGSHASAFHLDVGLSSSSQIARFWGIAADRPAMSVEVPGSPAPEIPLPVPQRPVVSGIPVTVARTAVTEAMAQRFDQFAGTGEGRSNAHGDPFDPREVITAALLKVGLLVPSGSKPAGDPRSIISSTLRSVGLLKE